MIALVANLDDLRVRWSELGWLARGLSLGGVVVISAGLYFAAPELPVLEKAAGFAAMPIGLIWLGWMVAAIVLARRIPRVGYLSAVGWLLLTLAGNEYVGQQLIGALEEDYAHLSPVSEEPFDAVFVLGGGVTPTEDGYGQLGQSGDRVALAARLYHAGIAPVLVASGASVPGMGTQWESGGLTEQIWFHLGVEQSAIVVVDEAYNTSREVEAYAELIRERGWGRVGVVTSAWHMRRVQALADAQGVTLHPLPADRRGRPEWLGLPSVVPTGAGFAAMHTACWEWFGALVGR